LLPSGGFLICELPTLALHRINYGSARIYHLMDEESIGLEEWLLRRELTAHRLGIYLKNFYSAVNYQLRDEESTGGIGFRWKLLTHTLDEKSTRGRRFHEE
jgi:hypothetical protein